MKARLSNWIWNKFFSFGNNFFSQKRVEFLQAGKLQRHAVCDITKVIYLIRLFSARILSVNINLNVEEVYFNVNWNILKTSLSFPLMFWFVSWTMETEQRLKVHTITVDITESDFSRCHIRPAHLPSDKSRGKYQCRFGKHGAGYRFYEHPDGKSTVVTATRKTTSTNHNSRSN